jgi:hypothetical protein
MVVYSAYVARDGKIAKRVCYADRDEALEAVGSL